MIHLDLGLTLRIEHGGAQVCRDDDGAQVCRDDDGDVGLLVVHGGAGAGGAFCLRHRQQLCQLFRLQKAGQHLPDREATVLCHRLVEVHHQDVHLGYVEAALTGQAAEGKVEYHAHHRRHAEPKAQEEGVAEGAEEVLECNI